MTKSFTQNVPAGATLRGVGPVTQGLVIRVHSKQAVGVPSLRGDFTLLSEEAKHASVVEKHLGEDVSHKSFVAVQNALPQTGKRGNFEEVHATLVSAVHGDARNIEIINANLFGRGQWERWFGPPQPSRADSLLEWHYSDEFRKDSVIHETYVRLLREKKDAAAREAAAQEAAARATQGTKPLLVVPPPLKRSWEVRAPGGGQPHPATGFPNPFTLFAAYRLTNGDSMEDLLKLQSLVDVAHIDQVEYRRSHIDQDEIRRQKMDYIWENKKLPGVERNAYHPYAQQLMNAEMGSPTDDQAQINIAWRTKRSEEREQQARFEALQR